MPVALHRTTSCSRQGHPEFTVQFKHRPLTPTLGPWLTSYLERVVGGGARFAPDQLVRVGGGVLRVSRRSDGTLGLEEREPTDGVWHECVDRTLRQLWLQREVVQSVGLSTQLAFANEDDRVSVARCAFESPHLLLSRLEPASEHGFSGWSLVCAEEDDHGDDRRLVTVLALTDFMPQLAQFFALPRGSSVLVSMETGHVRCNVYFEGAELEPTAGSYLAALNEAGVEDQPEQ